MWEGKYDTHEKNLSAVLANNTFTVNVIFCPSKANSWRLKNISCNRNKAKNNTPTHGKL